MSRSVPARSLCQDRCLSSTVSPSSPTRMVTSAKSSLSLQTGPSGSTTPRRATLHESLVSHQVKEQHEPLDPNPMLDQAQDECENVLPGSIPNQTRKPLPMAQRPDQALTERESPRSMSDQISRLLPLVVILDQGQGEYLDYSKVDVKTSKSSPPIPTLGLLNYRFCCNLYAK